MGKRLTLGVPGASCTLSNSSLVDRTTSAGCRDRPRLKKKAIVSVSVELEDESEAPKMEDRCIAIRRYGSNKQTGRGNGWPDF